MQTAEDPHRPQSAEPAEGRPAEPQAADLQKKGKGIEMDTYFNG